MNPQAPCCHTPQGPARGQLGQGNMRAHSQAAQRSRGTMCGQTFAATKETLVDRVRTAAEMVTLGLTRLSHGCPTQAIVAAFGVDARTVAAWLTRAGQPCERVHQPMVQQGCMDVRHVQADAVWVTRVGRRV